MEDDRLILHHYRLDHGGATPIDGGAALGHGDLVWIHLNGIHAGVEDYLRDALRLDPLVIKTMVAEETRPRFEENDNSALLILRGIHFNPGPEPEDLVSLRVWADTKHIVSVSRRPAKVVAEMEERLARRKGPKRAADFVTMLISMLQTGIEPAIHELEDDIDDVEEKLLDGNETDNGAAIAAIRRQAILFHRHIGPQRDVIYKLRQAQLSWLNEADRRYLKNNEERATRTLEDLDSIRARAQIVQDETGRALTSKLNRNIYVLSVITVVFMPLTFLTGLLGINVQGIPHADSPLAFAGVCLFLGLLVVIEVVLFRRMKWF
jgi:zinc transporter